VVGESPLQALVPRPAMTRLIFDFCSRITWTVSVVRRFYQTAARGSSVADAGALGVCGLSPSRRRGRNRCAQLRLQAAPDRTAIALRLSGHPVSARDLSSHFAATCSLIARFHPSLLSDSLSPSAWFHPTSRRSSGLAHGALLEAAGSSPLLAPLSRHSFGSLPRAAALLRGILHRRAGFGLPLQISTAARGTSAPKSFA
jgi:hypothetical protein